MNFVVFDVGQVIIRWDPTRIVTPHLREGEEAEAVLSELGFADWNRALDGGASFADGVTALAEKYPNRAALVRALDTNWADSVPELIDGTVTLLEKLRARDVPLYAVTNFSAEKWPVAQAKFPVLRGFRDVVVSGEERLLKPDPRIYRRLLDRNGLAAEDGVFIDDSPANIEGARAVGLDAILFTDPAGLAAELGQRGLLG